MGSRGSAYRKPSAEVGVVGSVEKRLGRALEKAPWWHRRLGRDCIYWPISTAAGGDVWTAVVTLSSWEQCTLNAETQSHGETVEVTGTDDELRGRESTETEWCGTSHAEEGIPDLGLGMKLHAMSRQRGSKHKANLPTI